MSESLSSPPKALSYCTARQSICFWWSVKISRADLRFNCNLSIPPTHSLPIHIETTYPVHSTLPRQGKYCELWKQLEHKFLTIFSSLPAMSHGRSTLFRNNSERKTQFESDRDPGTVTIPQYRFDKQSNTPKKRSGTIRGSYVMNRMRTTRLVQWLSRVWATQERKKKSVATQTLFQHLKTMLVHSTYHATPPLQHTHLNPLALSLYPIVIHFPSLLPTFLTAKQHSCVESPLRECLCAGTSTEHPITAHHSCAFSTSREG